MNWLRKLWDWLWGKQDSPEPVNAMYAQRMDNVIAPRSISTDVYGGYYGPLDSYYHGEILDTNTVYLPESAELSAILRGSARPYGEFLASNCVPPDHFDNSEFTKHMIAYLGEQGHD